MSLVPTPPTIHQIWFDWGVPSPPANHAVYMEKLKKLHPTWDYKLWSTDTAHSFLQTRAPEYLAVYDTFRYNIQRCDFFRLVVIYVLGGVYIDTDVEPMRALDPLLKHGLVLVWSPHEQKAYSNFFILAKPQHPFIKALLDDVVARHPYPATGILALSRSRYILESTGPRLLTRVAKAHPILLNSAFILPHEMTCTHTAMGMPLQSSKDAWMNHHWAKSWVSITPSDEPWMFLVAPALLLVPALIGLAIAAIVLAVHPRKTGPTLRYQRRLSVVAMIVLLSLGPLAVVLSGVGCGVEHNGWLLLSSSITTTVALTVVVVILTTAWGLLPMTRAATHAITPTEMSVW